MSNVAKLKKQAAELELKKQFDKALAIYVKLLDSFDENADELDVALFNRVGDLMLRQGSVADAVDYYEKAVDRYADTGFFNNAIALCNKILRHSPGRATVYYKLGKISAAKGFKNDAKVNFLEYADRMHKAGKAEEAFRAMKEFADLCPDQDEVRLMLADQLTKAGKNAEAVEQLQLLYERYESEGRTVEMEATATRIREIDPDIEVRSTTGPSRKVSSGDLIFLDLDEPTPPKRPSTQTPAPSTPVGNSRPTVINEPVLDESPAELGRAAGSMELTRIGDDAMLPDDDASGGSLIGLQGTQVDDESSSLVGGGSLLELESTEIGLESPSLGGLEVTSLSEPEPLVSANDEPENPLVDSTPRSSTPVGASAAVEETDGELMDLNSGLDLIMPEEEAEEATPEVLRPTPRSSLVALEGLPVMELDAAEAAEAVEEPVEESVEESAGAIESVSHEWGQFPDVSDSPSAMPTARASDEMPAASDDVAAEPEPTLESGDTDTDARDSAAAGRVSASAPRASTPVTPVSEPPARTSEPTPRVSAPSVRPSQPAARPSQSPLRPSQPASRPSQPPIRPSLPAARPSQSGVRPSEAVPRPSEGAPRISEPTPRQSTQAPRVSESAARASAAVPETASETPVQEREVRLTPAAAAQMAGRRSTMVAAQSAEILRASVEGDPENWDLRRRFAEVLLESGDRSGGIKELETAMAGAERAGDLDLASGLAEEIARLEPDVVRHHQKRVEYAFRTSDRGRLIEAYLGLADALLRADQPEKSRAVYQRVIDLAPDDVRARAALDTIVVPPPPTPAQATPGRQSTQRRTSAVQPTAKVPEPPRAEESFVNLGDWLRDEEAPKDTRMVVAEEEPTGDEDADFADMLKKFKQGVADNVDAEDYQSHYDLAIAFKEMGLIDEAIAEFQKSLGGPNRVPTFEALGQCFMEKKQYKLASSILGRALAEGLPDDKLIGVLYLLGVSAETQGNPAEALGYYQRVFIVDIQFRDIADRLSGAERAMR